MFAGNPAPEDIQKLLDGYKAQTDGIRDELQQILNIPFISQVAFNLESDGHRILIIEQEDDDGNTFTGGIRWDPNDGSGVSEHLNDYYHTYLGYQAIKSYAETFLA